MYRVIAALVALLCVVWGREAHAFIPCETSARWLCSGKCQALASDSPEWAEVQVCGDSSSAAATDAVAELMLQWGCAILDEGDPGPQDDLNCYECLDGEPCHAQGDLLGGIDWTNPGGLLGDLMGEFASCVLGNPECSILPTPEQCESGCSYYCMTAGYGYEEHWGTEGLWIWNGIVDVPCPGSAALAEQVVIADQAQRHGVTVTAETTTCASIELQLRLCEPDGSDPENEPTQRLCRWNCGGWSNKNVQPRKYLSTTFISPCDEPDTAESFAYDHWNTVERDEDWWIQAGQAGWPTWQPVMYLNQFSCMVVGEL